MGNQGAGLFPREEPMVRDQNPGEQTSPWLPSSCSPNGYPAGHHNDCLHLPQACPGPNYLSTTPYDNPVKTLKHFEWPEVGKALYMQLIFHLNGSDSSQIRSPSLYDFHSKAIEDASTPKKWYAPETASNRGGKSLIYGSMIHRKLNNYSNRTIHSSLYTSLSYTHRPTTFSLWAKTLLKSVTQVGFKTNAPKPIN